MESRKPKAHERSFVTPEQQARQFSAPCAAAAAAAVAGRRANTSSRRGEAPRSRVSVSVLVAPWRDRQRARYAR